MLRLRRALLFMPGDSRRKIEKAAALGVDTIIMDLEDGVAHSQKQAARETILAALRELDFGTSERLIRANPVVDGGLWEDDLRVTIFAEPQGYVLPKVEDPAQIRKAAHFLTALEIAHDLPQGSVKLIAILETALGIVNLREIAGCGEPRLEALIFGAEDLTGDLGAVRTADGHEVAYARAAVVLHAKAFGLGAVDTLHTDIRDTEGLIRETQVAIQMGYTGKLAIHPDQVAPIQNAFAPTPEQLAAALRLIRAYEAQQAVGAGVFVLDGRMVDLPMVRAAQAVIARGRAAGMPMPS